MIIRALVTHLEFLSLQIHSLFVRKAGCSRVVVSKHCTKQTVVAYSRTGWNKSELIPQSPIESKAPQQRRRGIAISVHLL